MNRTTENMKETRMSQKTMTKGTAMKTKTIIPALSLCAMLLGIETASAAENDNFIYEEMMTRHRAQRQLVRGVRNGHCVFHISINGNAQWKKKKAMLQEIQEKAKDKECKSITVYTHIDNVHVVEEPQHSSAGDYTFNLGVEVDQKTDVNSTVIIEDSDITTSYSNNGDKINAGIYIDSPGNSSINNNRIENRVRIRGSQIGSPDDLGFDAINKFLEGPK